MIDALLGRKPESGTLAELLGTLLLTLAAIVVSFAVCGLLIGFTGKDPLRALAAIMRGAFGTYDDIVIGLNKSTPYIVTGVGIALCLRARIINLGGEGQIALGGLGAAYAILTLGPAIPSPLLPLLGLVSGAIFGAAWAALAAIIHLWRRVHEVLVTLLLNFVAILLVAQALHGPIGEVGAGFPQTPLFPRASWLRPLGDGGPHLGIIIGIVLAAGGYLLLTATRFGFEIRVLGASRPAALYAGMSPGLIVLLTMILSGAVAGMAGAIEVQGIHYRLIEGYSAGFGFKALAVALLAATNPLAVIPCGLFFGFLEAGALSMQREVGINSTVVFIIQGLTIVVVLSAVGLRKRH